MTAKPLYSQLLRAAREDLQLTSDEAADELKVGPSTYRNAESGRGGKLVMKNLDLAFSADVAEEIRAAWSDHESADPPEQVDRFSADDLLLPVELLQGLAEARVTRFHPSRHYYSLLREGRSTISDYVAQATVSLEMVSINLATGMELERVIDTFESMLLRPKSTMRIVVSLLDPKQTYLMKSIAPVVRAQPKTLALRIQDTLQALDDFRRDRLPPRKAEQFEVYCHQVLPNSSAIIIDGDEEHGLLQLETKGYKMGMDKSYGFECQAPSEFFVNLRDSFRHLITDGRRVI
jgi:transcriptional regulator with XRE-family HTH domain